MEIVGLPQKDPNNSKLFVLVKMDSLDSLYFRQAMKRHFENPEGANDETHMKRLEGYKNFAKEVWKQTNPS